MVSRSIVVAAWTFSISTLALPQNGIGTKMKWDEVGHDMQFNISFWKSSDCQGKANSVRDVLFNKTIQALADNTPIRSYKVGRDMNFHEVLEFSNSDGSTPCAKKLEITSPDSNNHPLLKDVCYTFSKGPTAQCFTYYQPGGYGDIPESDSTLPPQLLKRSEDAGIRLDTWEQLHCPGDPTESHELAVNFNQTFKKEIRAYKVNRIMTSNEQLDFSQTDINLNPNDPCGKFVEKTNPMKTPVAGSMVLLKNHCYQFTGSLSAQCANFHY